MGCLHVGDRFFPCRSALVSDRRKILGVVELKSLAKFAKNDAAVYGVVPGSDVQGDFPDAVSFRKRMRGRGLGVYIGEQFEHGRAVPGVALEGVAQLFRKLRGFGCCG